MSFYGERSAWEKDEDEGLGRTKKFMVPKEMWKRKKWCLIIVVVALVAAIIALGVGLGVGLKKRGEDESRQK